MGVVLFILGALLGAAVSISAMGKLTKRADVMAIMDHVGVKPDMVPVLAILEVFAAIGLLAGIWNKPLGVAAAGGLVLYFVGAIVAHARKKDPIKDIAPALGLTVFSLLVLILEILR